MQPTPFTLEPTSAAADAAEVRLPLTLAGWRAAYAAGASARALLRTLHARLSARQGDAAWIALATPAQIAERADELEALARGCASRELLLQRHPLWGVPFAVKDNIDVAGWPTTAACPVFEHQPSVSATVVHRLLQAGAVLVGKTNLDQFATGLVGTRSPYGKPASVFAADRISGGSSSGSAVVVARGDVPFALGTDTAGSGRVPAAFNHIVGLKPTPGRVSTAGVLPACRSIDCVSVFALTTNDAAAVLALIEGADPADSFGAFAVGPGAMPQRLRIGVPRDAIVDPAQEFDTAWQHALALAQSLAAELVPLDFAPLHAVAKMLYDGPWVAERHTVVAALMAEQPAALDASVATVIGKARAFSATDTFRAIYRLRDAQRDTRALWQRVDLLMVPTAPRHPSFADVAADPIGANALLGTYTNFVNLLGWCALALPASKTTTGLPFGVTFIAPAQHDAALARFGRGWEHAAAQAPGRVELRAAAQAAAAAPPPLPAQLWPRSTPSMPIAVVGAHLSGLPLNSQLVERGATLSEATHTAPAYRLYELPNSQPRKPGLRRVAAGGVSIAVEVWDMPQQAVGSFLAAIPPPLGLGSIELADGRQVHGFLCEGHALEGAADISHHGGWRRYLQSL